MLSFRRGRRGAAELTVCLVLLCFFLSSGRVRWSSQSVISLGTFSSKPKIDDTSGLGDPHEGDLVLDRLLNPIPRIDFATYKNQKPQNHDDPKAYAFSTFLCTRNSSLLDPYFAATQVLVYRQLWSYSPSNHPFIVFVCPFTPEDQRAILRGQGAIVTELPLVNDIIPYKELAVPRWVDQFSKLGLWNMTQYKKIGFLDSDVFPVSNLDDYFDIVETRQCNKQVLLEEKHSKWREGATDAEIDEMCSYSFGAVEWHEEGAINGGMFVLSPNALMHKRLLELAHHPETFDSSRMEQGLLITAFGSRGPFPTQYLEITMNPPAEWNEKIDNFKTARVIHQKLWVPIIVGPFAHLKNLWDLGWMEMCRFFDSDEFAHARKSGRRKSALEIYAENLVKLEEEKKQKAEVSSQ